MLGTGQAAVLPPSPPSKRCKLSGSLLELIAATPVGSTHAELDALWVGKDVRIGTHAGSFHCDEALACAMLRCLPEFRNAGVVRTRNKDELAKCTLVCDVGAVYDHSKRLYDHHQRGFDDTLTELGKKTKLSSAGLIYRHYGADVLAAVAAAAGPAASATLAKFQDLVYRRVYEGLIEEVDGVDNGVDAVTGGTANYQVGSTLGRRVGRLNPSWNEDSGDDVRNESFKAAMALTLGEFLDASLGLVKSWLPARTIVIDALAKAKEVHPSGKILRLPRFCPWKSHLLSLEAEAGLSWQDKQEGILFCLYEDSSGKWRVQAVPPEADSFACRRKLPEPWRGVRNEELAALIGEGGEGAIFCHAAGFIAGHATYEGALLMATKALLAE